MTMTIDSGASAYASPDDLFARFDLRVIADWVSVDGRRYAGASNGTVTAATLAANTKVTTPLKTASGYVESIAAQGGKYTAGDLAALSASSTNGSELLKDIVCAIAMRKIGLHRVTQDPAIMSAIGEAQEWLDLLARGQAIFPFTQTQDASVIEGHQVTPAEADSRFGTSKQFEPLLGVPTDRSFNPYPS